MRRTKNLFKNKEKLRRTVDTRRNLKRKMLSTNYEIYKRIARLLVHSEVQISTNKENKNESIE